MATRARTWTVATVTAHEPVTPSIVSIMIQANIGPYEAGQHLDIRLTAPDGYQAERSYSIASAPGAGEIELLVDRIDEGEVSPYFHEAAAPGDTFEVRGPIGGHFVWRGESTDPIVLVAGGSGIAPLLSILRHRANIGHTAPFLLLYSARTWADIVYRDEIFAIEAADPGVTVVLTTTRGEAGREGDFARRIDPELISTVLHTWGERPGRVYVCGSNDFVDAATAGLIAVEIPSAIIRTERYG